MKTVLVASSKGGVGKTTIATHLAAQAALDGHRTVLVDADPQHSSTRWAERRAELERVPRAADCEHDGTLAVDHEVGVRSHRPRVPLAVRDLGPGSGKVLTQPPEHA